MDIKHRVEAQKLLQSFASERGESRIAYKYIRFLVFNAMGYRECLEVIRSQFPGNGLYDLIEDNCDWIKKYYGLP